MFRIATAALCVLLTSCGITLDHRMAPGLAEAKSVTIVKNPNTSRPSFHAAMADWLRRHNLKAVDATTEPPAGWSLSYSAEWSLSFVSYLTAARITARLDGAEQGFASYRVNGGALSFNSGKFKTDPTTVGEMMRRLVGKTP